MRKSVKIEWSMLKSVILCHETASDLSVIIINCSIILKPKDNGVFFHFLKLHIGCKMRVK